MKKIIALLAILLLSAAVIFLVINGRPGFTGSRVRNPDLYQMTFTRMSQEDSHDIVCKAGDSLQVEFSIGKGHVDLLVEGEDGTAIYRGDDIADGAFALGIPEDGTYHITVCAKRAAGSITIALK